MWLYWNGCSTTHWPLDWNRMTLGPPPCTMQLSKDSSSVSTCSTITRWTSRLETVMVSHLCTYMGGISHLCTYLYMGWVWWLFID